MIEISNADYAKIRRILNNVKRYNGLTRVRQDETRRQALLLTRKFERKEHRNTKPDKP